MLAQGDTTQQAVMMNDECRKYCFTKGSFSGAAAGPLPLKKGTGVIK